MARPSKVYRRRTLPGIELPISWKPPSCAVDWLKDKLRVANGFDKQLAAHSWAVWQVWRHERIDSKRVMLLCCVGERQARYLMDYAEALDRYMQGLYGAGARVPLMVDASDCPVWPNAFTWDKWAADTSRYPVMRVNIRNTSLQRLVNMLSERRVQRTMRGVMGKRTAEDDAGLYEAVRACEESLMCDV